MTITILHNLSSLGVTMGVDNPSSQLIRRLQQLCCVSYCKRLDDAHLLLLLLLPLVLLLLAGMVANY